MAKPAKNPKVYNDESNPPVCNYCGANMLFLGNGAYPYDCPAKDLYPQAAVFANCENGCSEGWTHGCNDNDWQRRMFEHNRFRCQHEWQQDHMHKAERLICQTCRIPKTVYETLTKEGKPQ